MARGYGRRRSSGIPPMAYAILAGIIFLALVGAVFFFSGQAESKKPEQKLIEVEATNVGPH